MITMLEQNQLGMRAMKSAWMNIIASALTVLSIVSLGACQPDSRQRPTASAAASVYDRVMQSGTMRCGYVIDPPGCRMDPNTKKLSGIGIETIELLGKNLNLKVEW